MLGLAMEVWERRPELERQLGPEEALRERPDLEEGRGPPGPPEQWTRRTYAEAYEPGGEQTPKRGEPAGTKGEGDGESKGKGCQPRSSEAPCSGAGDEQEGEEVSSAQVSTAASDKRNARRPVCWDALLGRVCGQPAGLSGVFAEQFAAMRCSPARFFFF